MKNKLSTLMVFGSALFALSGVTTFAVTEKANEEKTSTDTSRNPFTGTVEQIDKSDKKVKRLDGSEATRHMKRTTKYKTDGSVDRKTETDTTADQK